MGRGIGGLIRTIEAILVGCQVPLSWTVPWRNIVTEALIKTHAGRP